MIYKAIIPIAGLGSRMNPISNIISKEMLPILATPSIEMILDELVASGITSFFFIINQKKIILNKFIQRYFNNKNDINYHFVIQLSPKGLGHAVKLCEKFINPNEYFLLVLPDNLFSPFEFPISKVLIDNFYKINKTLISANIVDESEVNKRAVLILENTQFENNIRRIKNVINKPNISISNPIAISGRYVLNRDIFNFITDRTLFNNEISFTVALIEYCRIYDSYVFIHNTNKYDIGSKYGYYNAFVTIGNDFLKETAHNKVHKQ